jgi:hypothetical protein
MKILFPRRYLWFFLLLFPLSPLTSLLLADETLKILVRKGDTISYLSFRTYGMYNLQMAEILKRENPQVKDIALIYAGQQLNFPAPEVMKKKAAEKDRMPTKPSAETEAKEARPAILSAPSVSDTQVRAQKGVITYLEGEVQVKRSGDTQWALAQPNMILSENDQVKVLGQSRAELILDNQSVMRLSENTLLTIKKLEEESTTQKETTRMEVSLGRIWVRMSKLFNPSSRYDVKTPTVIAGVQGTTFQVTVAGDQSTAVQVFQGSVNIYNPFPKGTPSLLEKPTQVERPKEIAGPRVVPGPAAVSREEWTQIVLHQFQQVTVTGREVPKPTPFDLGRERRSGWVRWNEERDEDFKPPAAKQ